MTTTSLSNPAAKMLVLDLCDRPHTYWLSTVDIHGELLDIVGDYSDSDTAHAAAEAAAKESGLPLSIKHTPLPMAEHFAEHFEPQGRA